MIIGLTGTLGAGKGSVAEILKNKGFAYYSCSDYLRGELKKKGIEENIPNLANLGNEIRQKYGAGEIPRRLLKQIKEKNVIVDSLRHPEEIKALEGTSDFTLVAVDAPIKLRYNRIKNRKRAGDNISLKEFKKQEEEQMKGEGANMQLAQCIKMAKKIIVNDSSMSVLKIKLDRMLKDIGFKEEPKLRQRPNWDEYFMKIATLVAERSTCLRHHVGAIAVKDKRILATGYNGAVAGTKDCLELGCLRNELGIASGTRHEICRAIHAEQNVVVQAAIHGIRIEGATIYCTHSPCILCAKILANSKIKEVVTFSKYADQSFKDLFKEAGIKFRTIKKPDLEISFLE